MKILAINAGNSRIKWGLHEDAQWLKRGAVETVEAVELGKALAQPLAPDRIVVANVAGEAVAACIAAALGRFDAAPHWLVSRAEQCGVRSSYARPDQLGADRWAALIGARARYDGPCVVVNAGTTMTVDALSAEGLFLGGFIVPGYALMCQSLSNSTALLKRQDGSLSYFPDNTGDARVSGAVNALAGAVERMLRYMTEIGEGDAAILLSGGDAATIGPLLNGRVQVVDNLVLEGLICIGTGDV
jgi:type III pantothenate kinase